MNDELREKMQDQAWRLNNLYKIVNKDGKLIPFKMNWAQQAFFEELWYKNVILKARQLGMSTFVGILQLDTCMFNSNMRCGTVAHELNAVSELFNNNIMLPYENLSEALKNANPPTSKTRSRVEFQNNSSIRVATSLRGSSLQLLHVSEMGKIAAKYPERAKEVVTGSMEAVGKDGITIVESTAEGREGYFFDWCDEAQKNQIMGKKLSKEDYQFHFFPWYNHPDYTLEPEGVVISDARQAYFQSVEADLNIKLDASRRAWYVAKAAKLGDDMLREYPSTPEEAFHQSIEGAYFATSMKQAREQGRIGDYPHNPNVGVFTSWDIGVADETVIWFGQAVNGASKIHWIDCYANHSEGLAHYANVLQQYAFDYGYSYTDHYGPHDLAVFEIGADTTRVETARRLGINFTVIPRPQRKADAIQSERNMLAVSHFDEKKCAKGIQAVDEYRREWDERLGVYKDRPRHDWCSHYNDALQCAAAGLSFQSAMGSQVAQARKTGGAIGWT